MASRAKKAFDLRRKLRRADFYLRGVARDAIPYALFAAARKRLFAILAPEQVPPHIVDRVNYCMRHDAPFSLAHPGRIRDIALGDGSFYYYDLRQYAKCFDPDLKIYYRFGDIIYVPDEPAIVKSRPIAGDNRNSVVMNLDKLRHFARFPDRLAFSAKARTAIWRGAAYGHSGLRQALIRAHDAHPRHDIGYTGRRFEGFAPKPFLTPEEQLRHRYVISVEGNEVATNLKWILASQSLCLMPRPAYETWFMEGTLLPGVHYVELRPDFADLDDTIAYFDRHEDEARAIIANANAHAAKYAVARDERLASLLILQKYFERSGQLPAEPFSAALFDRPAAAATRPLPSAPARS
ncbi:MAG: lipopolysaccharide biosynthesis protein [Rhizobiales bacterium]|nr:lipopolysaccharide biosynthesis protein [Hyphomicrobiales bacterium]